MGGIGDLIVKFLCFVGFMGCVMLVDINLFMLKVGCDKFCDCGLVSNIDYV